jgi:FtsH-binding integral membrane protein
MENQKIITGVETQASVSSFLSKVFLWMAAGLAITTAGSFWLLAQPQLFAALMKNQWIFFGLVIVELGLVIWLSAALMKISAGLATTLFLVYSFLNGVTLSPLFWIYTGVSVATTFAVTAGTFFFFSLYGFTTKRDLTTMGGLMTMGLIGVILASIVNIFVKSSMLDWIVTFVAIAVFMGLIAWDTQKLKAMHARGFENSEVQRKMTIIGALALYLDFVNLFIQLLKIFGKRRN